MKDNKTRTKKAKERYALRKIAKLAKQKAQILEHNREKKRRSRTAKEHEEFISQ